MYLYFVHTEAAEYTLTHTLVKGLLKNYMTSMIPLENDNHTMEVGVTFSLISFNSYNEVSGTLSLTGKFELKWKDEFIVWKPSNLEGKTELDLSYDLVWLPNLHLANAADEKTVIQDEYSFVTYSYTGDASWKPVVIVKSICTPDMTLYPKDRHVCVLSFTPWGYTSEKMMVRPLIKKIDTSFLEPSAQWVLQNSTTAAVINQNYSMVYFTLVFERVPKFLFVNIFIPIFGLGFVNLMAFLLPVASGERVSFCLTVLLAFTVYMTIVGDHLPQVSSPIPYTCYTLLAMFFNSALIALANIVSIYFYYKEENEAKPSVLQQLVGKCSRSKVGIAKDQTKSTAERTSSYRKDPDFGNHGNKRSLQSQDSTVSLYILHEERVSSKTAPGTPKCTWQEISAKFDRLFAIIFFMLDVLFVIFFCLTMLNG